MIVRKTTKKANRGAAKKGVLSKKKARVAAKTAKKLYAAKKKAAKRPAAWKEGGREWSRILGHFGLTN